MRPKAAPGGPGRPSLVHQGSGDRRRRERLVEAAAAIERAEVQRVLRAVVRSTAPEAAAVVPGACRADGRTTTSQWCSGRSPVWPTNGKAPTRSPYRAPIPRTRSRMGTAGDLRCCSCRAFSCRCAGSEQWSGEKCRRCSTSGAGARPVCSTVCCPSTSGLRAAGRVGTSRRGERAALVGILWIWTEQTAWTNLE